MGGAAGCTKNRTLHQNCIIFCAFAILVAFVTLEGKGGGGLAVGWEENNTSQIYYIVAFATCVRKGGWGGMEKNPAHHQKYITFAVCAILHLQHLWERGEGGGGRWVGHKSNPPSELYYMCCICYTEY